MLKFCIVIILITINIAKACNKICEYKPNNLDQVCFSKARECLWLKCDQNNGKLMIWIRQSNNLNTTVFNASSGIPADLSNFYETDSPIDLNITYVRSVDSGLDSFLTFNSRTKDLICKFNILVYDSSWNGSLTIQNETKLLNSSETFNIELKTFNKKVNFTYQYEAMPLDYLTLNNTKLEAEMCDGTLPWLNCLVAQDVDLNLERCTKNIDLHLSYNYSNNYTGLQEAIKIKNFTHSIFFKCK